MVNVQKVAIDDQIIANLSKISMPIYLFHQQIIYFTIIFFNGRIYPLLNIFVNFFAAIFISNLLSSIMLKYKYTRLLIGEKLIFELFIIFEEIFCGARVLCN